MGQGGQGSVSDGQVQICLLGASDSVAEDESPSD